MERDLGCSNKRYIVVGEHYKRRVRNREIIIMVRTFDGQRRDAIPSLLEMLPNFEKIFSEFDQRLIRAAACRERKRMNCIKNKLAPLRPKKTDKPKFHLIINKNYVV